MLSALFQSCGCGARRKPKASRTTDGTPNENTRLLTGSIAPTNPPHRPPLPASPQAEENIPHSLEADLISEGEDSRSTLEDSLSTPPEPASQRIAAGSPEIQRSDVSGESEAVDAWEAEARPLPKTSTAEAEVSAISPEASADMVELTTAEPAPSSDIGTANEHASAAANVSSTAETSTVQQQQGNGDWTIDAPADTADQTVLRAPATEVETTTASVAEAASPVAEAGSAQKSKKGKNGKGKGKKTGKKRDGAGRYRPR